MAYGKPDIGDGTIANVESLDVFAHFHNGTNGFVSRNQLAEVSEVLRLSIGWKRTHRKLGREFAFMDVGIRPADTCAILSDKLGGNWNTTDHSS